MSLDTIKSAALTDQKVALMKPPSPGSRASTVTAPMASDVQ